MGPRSSWIFDVAYSRYPIGSIMSYGNGRHFSVWRYKTGVSTQAVQGKWNSNVIHVNERLFYSKEEAQATIDEYLLSKGYVFLDMERWQKLSVLV